MGQHTYRTDSIRCALGLHTWTTIRCGDGVLFRCGRCGTTRDRNGSTTSLA